MFAVPCSEARQRRLLDLHSERASPRPGEKEEWDAAVKAVIDFFERKPEIVKPLLSSVLKSPSAEHLRTTMEGLDGETDDLAGPNIQLLEVTEAPAKCLLCDKNPVAAMHRTGARVAVYCDSCSKDVAKSTETVGQRLDCV